MDEVAQYKEHADECRRLAATVKNPEHKKPLLEMAAAWDTVGRQKSASLLKRFERTHGQGAAVAGADKDRVGHLISRRPKCQARRSHRRFAAAANQAIE